MRAAVVCRGKMAPSPRADRPIHSETLSAVPAVTHEPSGEAVRGVCASTPAGHQGLSPRDRARCMCTQMCCLRCTQPLTCLDSARRRTRDRCRGNEEAANGCEFRGRKGISVQSVSSWEQCVCVLLLRITVCKSTHTHTLITGQLARRPSLAAVVSVQLLVSEQPEEPRSPPVGCTHSKHGHGLCTHCTRM